MVMIFSCEKPRRQLLEKGEVITFRRKERRRVGEDWMTDKRGGEKICDIFIEQMFFIPTKSTMSGFLWWSLDKSGFDTTDEWIKEIKRLNKGKSVKGGYLYLVKRRTKRNEEKQEELYNETTESEKTVNELKERFGMLNPM